MLCCIGTYIYKRRVLDKKEDKGIQVEEEEEEEPPKQEARPTTETVSVDLDVLHVRSVEETKNIKNVFRKPRFMTHC